MRSSSPAQTAYSLAERGPAHLKDQAADPTTAFDRCLEQWRVSRLQDIVLTERFMDVLPQLFQGGEGTDSGCHRRVSSQQAGRLDGGGHGCKDRMGNLGTVKKTASGRRLAEAEGRCYRKRKMGRLDSKTGLVAGA